MNMKTQLHYTTPTLTLFGSVKDATTAGSGGSFGPKGGNASEGNPGLGQGDMRRP